MLNLSGVKKSVLVRALLTVILAINICFGYMGWRLIPFTNDEVGVLVDAGVVILTALVWAWSWWKNNSFTVNAQTADELLSLLNSGVLENSQNGSEMSISENYPIGGTDG